uniref:DNA-directed RNA polymerase n=1 Tax=Characiochloris acuminata TaxID=167768 RepID=A0A0S2LQC2_9CHLO|nr:beta subunit of RNA polymerase [Characiochloris acuminata]ALO63320.1 beta subunit of RNA polymerase [Characiochloris acuminata]
MKKHTKFLTRSVSSILTSSRFVQSEVRSLSSSSLRPSIASVLATPYIWHVMSSRSRASISEHVSSGKSLVSSVSTRALEKGLFICEHCERSARPCLSEQLNSCGASEYNLETFHRSNQDTCLNHKPLVKEGDWVQSGEILTDCSSSIGGELSLGQNLLIAYMPWEGFNFEDAILISERLVLDDLYTSVHIERYEIEPKETKLGKEEITRDIPDVTPQELEHLDSRGIAKLGSWIEEGDILIGRSSPINKKAQSPYQKLLYTILEKDFLPIRDTSLRAPRGIKAKVIDIQIFLRKNQKTSEKPLRSQIKVLGANFGSRRASEASTMPEGARPALTSSLKTNHKNRINKCDLWHSPRRGSELSKRMTASESESTLASLRSALQFAAFPKYVTSRQNSYTFKEREFSLKNGVNKQESKPLYAILNLKKRNTRRSCTVSRKHTPQERMRLESRKQIRELRSASRFISVELAEESKTRNSLRSSFKNVKVRPLFRIRLVSNIKNVANLQAHNARLSLQSQEIAGQASASSKTDQASASSPLKLNAAKRTRAHELQALEYQSNLLSSDFSKFGEVMCASYAPKARRYPSYSSPRVIHGGRALRVSASTFAVVNKGAASWPTFALASLRSALQINKSFTRSFSYSMPRFISKTEANLFFVTKGEHSEDKRSEYAREFQTKARERLSFGRTGSQAKQRFIVVNKCVRFARRVKTKSSNIFKSSLGFAKRGSQHSRVRLSSLSSTRFECKGSSLSTIQIFLAEKRKIQIGDKMAGRHGNKGIISQILPLADMPYLPNGSPIDMVLNPLGVPSRMNVGQIYECLLGLAGKFLGENYKIFPFDEIYGAEASRSFVFSKLYEARQKTGCNWLFNPDSPGKIRIFDGRTGEGYDQPVTVGIAYMLRLVHMVDDKIHMRSTGPYSLVTQQPLRGRSKQGGQRLGEMEVWALEGYGAAFTLLEMLTIKSDDMTGRMTLWSNLIRNKDISIGTPESFKVLICELQALCLDIGIFRYNTKNLNDVGVKTTHHNIRSAFEAQLGTSGIANKEVNRGLARTSSLNLIEINNLMNLP